MKSKELRTLRKTFRESKWHKYANPASLIVNSADDATTMFNTAGMQPLVPYLMGKEHPTGSDKVYNIQWCIRTVDIDEVWDTSHLTFFEMMWNRSLWSYFKEDAIAWSREFLTEILKLDKEMLSVTIFEWDKDAPLDQEAKDIWLGIWLPEYRITPLWKEDNRWGPAWASWPCGPDTEIFYRVWVWDPPKDSNPWNDDTNWLEIWNNVFMAYYKDDAWVFTELEKKNVDTWMWFERILMVLSGQKQKNEWKILGVNELSVYSNDIFDWLFKNLSKHTVESYVEIFAQNTDLSRSMTISYRIVADHLKTSLMLINEWLVPSNEWRGYVLRRIIRRWYYHLKKLTKENSSALFSNEQWIYDIIHSILWWLVNHYEVLKAWNWNEIKILSQEMFQFEQTLQKWAKKIDELLSKHDGSIFSWTDAFLLYDTFGVPVELTKEIVSTSWLIVDMAWYEAALEQAKLTSRSWSGEKFAKGVNRADHIEWIPETKFIWYWSLSCDTSKVLKDFEIQWSRYMIFDCTPFYAESWWQKWDSWNITLDDGSIIYIEHVFKYGGIWLHKVA